GTYMNQNTRLKNCLSCTNCDPGSGLRIKRSCTLKSNTVCEPLEGFYCIDSKEHSCVAAEKHTACKPGQYIKREYPTGDGLCCPMCHRGTVIQQDCTRELGTCCSPCRSGTFMNNPSGLNACFPCTPCDTDTLHGLFALQNCTSTADTVCDVLSGYLCKSLANNKGCMMAEEHSQCAPGQGIKQLGTSRTDNVCEDYFSQDVVACKLSLFHIAKAVMVITCIFPISSSLAM
uniref:TNFR-Cys domain-containing protein n=1 Tax=Echeneis naucrates TaxID=173247 RepID=A0A665WZT4_ECHNA